MESPLTFADQFSFLVYQVGPPVILAPAQSLGVATYGSVHKLWWRDSGDVLHYAESYDRIEWVEGEPYGQGQSA